MMTRLAARYPGYGWERNQGYATREHRAAIRQLGPGGGVLTATAPYGAPDLERYGFLARVRPATPEAGAQLDVVLRNPLGFGSTTPGLYVAGFAATRDFGPFFLKFCSYFPYNAKLCINGHEYLKRQVLKRGVAFEALDNGVRSCEDPARLQRLADTLSAEKIDALLRKWLARLPHPFTAADRAAGYRYDISILQAEFSLTQMLDKPVSGRVFFEQVIRDNLDIGRPDDYDRANAEFTTRKSLLLKGA